MISLKLIIILPNNLFYEKLKLFFVIFLPTFSQPNINKTVIKKSFYLLRFSLLRLSTIKPLFKVAFIAIIYGSISIYSTVRCLYVVLTVASTDRRVF